MMIAHKGEFWRWRNNSGTVEYVIRILGPPKAGEGCLGRVVEIIRPRDWLKLGLEQDFGLPYETEFEQWVAGAWMPAYPPLMVECPECGEDFALEDDYLCEKCLLSGYPSLA